MKHALKCEGCGCGFEKSQIIGKCLLPTKLAVFG
jgi:hypothetical protein